MAAEQLKVRPEAHDLATHVVAKGKTIYFQHDQDRAFTTRESFFVTYVGPGRQKGWGWYRTLAPTTFWRDGIQTYPESTLILVGPRSVIKKKQKT